MVFCWGLLSVKADVMGNEHVKINYFQVRGSGHSYQCLVSTAALCAA